jgi:hypothetical protein
VRIRLALFLAVALFGFQTFGATNSVSTNFVSIHLEAKLGAANVFAFGAEKFDLHPILSDADFVSFDAEAQTFTVTGPAALRLSNAMFDKLNFPAPDLLNGMQESLPFPLLFVLTAEGQPIYVGRFYSLVLSQTYSEPLVVASSYAVSTNQIQPVEFHRYEFFGHGKNEKGNPNTPGDPRIAKAVTKLMKSRGM